MATSCSALSVTGVIDFKTNELRSTKLNYLAHPSSRLNPQRKSIRLGPKRKISASAEYNSGRRGGGGDLLAGFLLGGAVFGTLAYIFAPQIRRSILNEDESGFRKAKRPIYYDDGLEKTRQTLNAKIGQLNSAIDNVSSRLIGRKNVVEEPTETNSEVEASM